MGERTARAVDRRRWIVGIVLVLVTAGGAAAGCALDDTAITQVVAGDDGSIFDGGANEASDDAPSCVPQKCDNFPSDCHPVLDAGCGTAIDCSLACPGQQACVTDGGPDAASFYCNGAPVCNDAGEPGNSCGVLTNPGNGLQTNCGGCDAGFSCASSTCGCAGTICGGIELCCQSASGTPNCNDTNTACCKRKTCPVDYAGFCNAASDNGCGTSNLNCSANCTVPGQGCAPDTVCDTIPVCNNNGQPGGNCGTLTSTHGIQTVCNSCSNGYVCTTNICTCASAKTCGTSCCPTSGDVCTGTNTCCTPESMAAACTGVCGNDVLNNCNQVINCNGCSTHQKCETTTNCDCNSGDDTCTNGEWCCPHAPHDQCQNTPCP